MSTFGLWISTALGADWRVLGGGEFNADPHGIIEVGYRDELIQIEWLTNTLELKREMVTDSGRKWGAIRGEAVMAGLLPFPWVDGRPAPELGSDASLARVEFGSVKYYQWSMYAGGIVQLGKEWFAHGRDSLFRSELQNRFVTHPQIILGRYTEELHAYLQIGNYLLDIDTKAIQNYAQAHLYWKPKWRFAPTVESHAATSENLDALHRFRIGGLNPYVIPLAGAAWGEWWAEEFASLQLGIPVNITVKQTTTSLKPIVDFARFDEQSAYGFGFELGTIYDRFIINMGWGMAPSIQRAKGVGHQSLWIEVGQRYTTAQSK